MRLFVGLGNPGRDYAGHRHNIGFMAVDAIARRHRAPAFRARLQGQVGEVSLDGERVVLLKPETYMNESGRAVREAAKFYKIELSDITVFHDELDLGPGVVRVKGRRRQCRAQRPAVDYRRGRQRLPPGSPRHRPSRVEGSRPALRARQFREERAALGRDALRGRSRRCRPAGDWGGRLVPDQDPSGDRRPPGPLACRSSAARPIGGLDNPRPSPNYRPRDTRSRAIQDANGRNTT